MAWLPAGTRQLGLDEYFPTMGADIDSKSSKKMVVGRSPKMGRSCGYEPAEIRMIRYDRIW